jgi:predicted 3-demethylubiquinone-9 3-methyltransferase (glyoxalase superfamily)
MTKEYSYYRKRSFTYALIALIAMLLAFSPILFGVTTATSGFIFENKHIITIIQIVLGSTGIAGYLLSVHNDNKGTAILRDKVAQKKKEAFNGAIALIRDGKSQEAIDALYDYLNKYH